MVEIRAVATIGGEQLDSKIVAAAGRSLILASYQLNESREPIERTLVVRVIEPFTWAWVGVSLATGVVGWIGGKAFQLAFFPDATNNQVIDALSRKIDEAFQKLQKYIDARLEAQVIDFAQRKCSSIYRLLIEYSNDPQGGDLQAINRDANELWDLLYQRGDAAFIPSTIAASLKSAALYARYLQSGNDAGARKNVIDFLDLSISSLSAWKDQIYQRNHIFELTELGPVSCTHEDQFEPNPKRLDTGPEGRPFSHHWWCRTSFRANGLEYIGQSGDRPNEDNARNAALNNAAAQRAGWLERRDIHEPFVNENIILPAEAMLTKLSEARQQLAGA